ncbi:hypothetical protein DEU56DRAFT_347536 [Suillus clintonianus]|uniref:uncharacterized protein n=1 Tax=Suillus clintonianus TaxID=1904413 RepID=UPI001B873C92|nr:uncharacterized protein DEU56DRAFT_347536 [Suillus clintonianus]KAG2138030.1 hypothetical protein DEU56DRAFT_347536 [Suillus clintonianus]
MLFCQVARSGELASYLGRGAYYLGSLSPSISRFWLGAAPLEALSHNKYLFPKDEADTISAFLTPMLQLHPERRAKVFELVYHTWLDL